MKKILMILIVMLLLVTSVFADDLTSGEQLKAYGLISGDENGNLLEQEEMTRAELYKTIILLMGNEEKAIEMSLEEKVFEDVALEKWYAPYVNYAKATGLTTGVTPTTFVPDKKVDAQTAATLLLRVLGYSPKWERAIEEAEALSIQGSFEEDFNRGKAFQMIYDALSVDLNEKDETLGASLKIEDYMVIPEEPVKKTILKIDEVTPKTNQIIELSLEEPIDSVELIDLTVKRNDEEELIKNLKFAPWATDNKVLLVEMESALTSGEVYSLVSGEETFKVGALGEDTEEPTIESLEVTDPETLEIEFNESIMIDDIIIEVKEKYGNKEILEILTVDYIDDQTLEVVTKGQASATLYGIRIEGAVDLSDNKMVADRDRTFTGVALPTDEQSINTITAKDAYTLEVTYEIKYDPRTAFNEKNYLIKERYNETTEVAIDSVEEKIVDDTVDENTVILNLDTPTKEATLYLLEINSVKTLYGENMDTDENTETFTGKAIDDEEPSDIDVTSKSNTTIEVEIIDESSIKETIDLDLFSIEESYGDKASLDIVAIKEVDTDTNKITLITEAQSESTLYQLTIEEGFEDKFGNATEEALEGTFSGKKIADAIDSISIVNVSKGKIKIDFNESYGEGALSIDHYEINEGIGYPSRVEAIDDNEEEVYLYINGLENGELYELTVNGIQNADGVPMASEGVKAKFGGMYE